MTLGMLEVNQACQIIQNAVHDEAEIIFGSSVDENIGEGLRITVIATRFEEDSRPQAQQMAANVRKIYDPSKPAQPEKKAQVKADDMKIAASQADDRDIPAFLRRSMGNKS